MNPVSYKRLTTPGKPLQKLPETGGTQDSSHQIVDRGPPIATVLPYNENSITTSIVVNDAMEIKAKFVGKPEPHVTLNTSSSIGAHRPKTSNVLRKLGFIFVLIVAVIIVVVIVYLSVLKKDDSEDTLEALSQSVSEGMVQDLGNDIHLIRRNRWGGRPILDGYQNRTLIHPTKLVIIGHTVSSQCMTIESCSSSLQSIQNNHVSNRDYHDIGYNFLVGGDGNIYQALGWDIRNYLRDNSIQIQFMGNYIYDQVQDKQREALKALLDYGVKLGKIDKDYFMFGQNQVMATQSPGRNLLAEIKTWSHYSNQTLN